MRIPLMFLNSLGSDKAKRAGILECAHWAGGELRVSRYSTWAGGGFPHHRLQETQVRSVRSVQERSVCTDVLMARDF